MGSYIDFGASLCFSDAVYKPAIRRQVTALLKQTGPDADKQLQAFLDANGYKTTAASVRGAFDTWKDERPKITPTGVRFAAEFLTNSNLRTAWIQAAQTAAASPPSQSKAAVPPGQPDPSLAPLSKVLADYGYPTLSPEDAVVAQANLMDDAATMWTGVYDTTVTPRQDNVDTQHQSPPLSVSADHIKLGLINLIGAAFGDDDLTLTWVQDPPGAVSNNTTTGELVFSTRADGSKVFTGTLTYLVKGRGDTAWDPGAYDFEGSAPAPTLPPAGGGGGSGSSGSDPMAIAGLIVGVLGMIAGAVGTFYAYRQWRQAEAAAEPNRNPPNDPPNDPPADDPLAEPDSPASRSLSDVSDISADVVQRIEPPLAPEVMSRVAPESVVELSQSISAPPSSPVSQSVLDSQASAAADDLNSDDEFDADPEPTPEPEPEPVDV